MAYVKALVKKSGGRKPLTAEQKIESKARARALQIIYEARPEIIAKRSARRKAIYATGVVYTKVLVRKKPKRRVSDQEAQWHM